MLVSLISVFCIGRIWSGVIYGWLIWLRWCCEIFVVFVVVHVGCLLSRLAGVQIEIILFGLCMFFYNRDRLGGKCHYCEICLSCYLGSDPTVSVECWWFYIQFLHECS
jgi:hypothetical protein